MKLMFISDVHGSAYYMEKSLNKFEKEKCDYLISLGDLLYHGPRNDLPIDYAPKKVAAMLNKYKDKIISVRGNCDSEVDQMMLEFPMLSDYTHLFIDGHRFFLTHGHHYHKDALPPLSKNDVLVYGHYHVPLAQKEGDIFILNPSSVSLPKAGTNSFGIYEDHIFTIKTFEDEIVASIDLRGEDES